MEFSEIEKKILLLMADEFNAKAIAGKLNITIKAVTSHKERMRKRTNTLNSIGLIVWAIKNKIINIT